MNASVFYHSTILSLFFSFLVEEFIQTEIEETGFSEKYLNAYDNRFIIELTEKKFDNPPNDLNIDSANFKQRFDELYNQMLPEKMAAVNDKLKSIEKIMPIITGQTKAEELIIENKLYQPDELENLFERLTGELEKAQKKLEDFDCRVLAYHTVMAKELGHLDEYRSNYYFIVSVQIMLDKLNKEYSVISHTIEKSMDDEDDRRPEVDYVGVFNSSRNTLLELLNQSAELPLPNLKNMETIDSLKDFLLNEPLVSHFSYDVLEGEQINQLIEQLSLVQNRLNRIHAKSLGRFISFQEQLAEQYFKKL